MNEIMTFVNEEFGSVRSTMINGEPWLVGKDIATILGYENQNRDIIRHVDEEDRLILNQETQYRFGIEFDYRALGQRGGWMVNESGFYSLVLASKLPGAKRFKRWVTADVLPTMRRTGGFVSNEDMFVETYLPFADDAVKNLFKLQCQVINQLNERIRRDEPKVRFADHVSDTVNLIDMNEMAKLCADHGIRIGRTRLFAWLRAKGILIQTDPKNIFLQIRSTIK